MLRVQSEEVPRWRLVNRKWNQAAVVVLRRIQAAPKFQTDKELRYFLLVMENSFQPLPYSKFYFELYAFTIRTLSEFATKLGTAVEELVIRGNKSQLFKFFF